MRKSLFYLSSFWILFACSQKEANENFTGDFSFSYTLDTVDINSLGTFFFLNNGLSGSTLSEDSRYLYTYNRPKLRLDIIDLEELILKDTLSFDVEGPKGVGSLGVSQINLTDSGKLYFATFEGIREFDAEGNLLKIHNWDTNEVISSQLRQDQMISFLGEFSRDGSNFYGTYSAFGRAANTMADGLAIINMETNKLKTVEVPALKALKEYEISFEVDGLSSTAGDQYFLSLTNQKLIISQSSINGVSVYDLQQDSLLVYSYETELLPARKPGNFPRKANSMEAFEEAMNEKSKEPYFGSFLYSEKDQLYYRVSFTKAINGSGELVWNGILSVFDENFKLIHEEEGLGRYSGKTFIREGKIYRFINLEDEMAFEILTPVISKK
jgi:hypothetical protein